MKPLKPSSAYLFEMLESARIVRDYAAGLTFDDFWDRSQTRDAVAMRLTVIGEAAGKVDTATEAAIPAVPIPKISATPQPHRSRLRPSGFHRRVENHAGRNPVAHRRARRVFQKQSAAQAANLAVTIPSNALFIRNDEN